jgi:hypothetical protein
MRRGISASAFRRQASMQLGLAVGTMPNTKLGTIPPAKDNFRYQPAQPGVPFVVVSQKTYNEKIAA